MFPGELLFASRSQTYLHAAGGKDTVWALYLRAMLLWNACVRIRQDASIGDLDRRDFAMRAWHETESIEKALQGHTCSVERAFMYNGREFLFKYVNLTFILHPLSPYMIAFGPALSVPTTAPGCAFLTNFRDSYLMCELLPCPLNSTLSESSETDGATCSYKSQRLIGLNRAKAEEWCK